MPLIQVKIFVEELDRSQSRDLIQKTTDAVTDVTSEKLHDATWVVIDEVKSGHWGVGGRPIGLEDVKSLMAPDESS